jgi:hypothetical protein
MISLQLQESYFPERTSSKLRAPAASIPKDHRFEVGGTLPGAR